MPSITVEAPAKLNLTLDVLARREDGYHDMRMVMQSVSLADRLYLSTEPGTGISLETDLDFLPTDGKNLAVAAAQVFLEETGEDLGHISIRIEKKVPVCAGMAGGSSDAAAVLRGLNMLSSHPMPLEALVRLGERVGSDVPYCVLGCTALAEGRGERLRKLPGLPECWAVIAKPPFPISTPELFRRLDTKRTRCHPDTPGVLEALEAGDLRELTRRMYNIFEEVLLPRHRDRVEELKQALVHHGALGASMTGTGPTVFGLFDSESVAKGAYSALKRICSDTYLVRTL